MSAGASFTGAHPRQIFIVAGSCAYADVVAKTHGWTRKFGNALTWTTGDGHPVRYVGDASKLTGFWGQTLLLGPNWRRRNDRDVILSIIGENRFEVEEIA